MHKHKRKEKIKGTGGAGKTIVMSLLERGDRTKKSKVKANVVPNTLKDTILKEVRDNVELGSELFTDTAGAYSGIERTSFIKLSIMPKPTSKGKFTLTVWRISGAC